MRFPNWCRAITFVGASGATAAVLASTGPDRATRIMHDLRSLDTTGTVLHVGAHPDDENTNLIAYLSRGRGYRAAYLSVTRGDGGQNELGSDFSEKLGVARTQELLAARRLDGGSQFFTRAIDFGFSKSPEETLRIWDHDAILSDVVRVIRKFRPDVIVTRFPIPPGSGGHGQHTASAMLAVEAFKLSGDPKAFPEQLEQGLQPWQAKRVLWNSWRSPSGSGLDGPVITVDIGGDDPVTGESFAAIANESRAMHKTQGLGGFAGRGGGGSNPQSFMLLAGEPATSDLMDGVDTTWARFPDGRVVGEGIDGVIARFDTKHPEASVPALLEVRDAMAGLVPSDPLLKEKRAKLDSIIAECRGLSIAVLSDRPEVVPGQTMQLSVIRSNEFTVPGVQVALRILVDGRVASRVVKEGLKGETAVGTERTVFQLEIPADTRLTQPYWLREEGTAGIAAVDSPKDIGLPENPPAIDVEVDFNLGGAPLTLTASPVYKSDGKDLAVAIVPPVSIDFDSDVYVVSPGTTKAVTVRVANALEKETGSLRLDAPPGWKVVPHDTKFELDGDNGVASFTFDVSAPPKSGPGSLEAVATIGGRDYSNKRQEIRYEHIPVQLLQPPAKVHLASFDFQVLAKEVGYLPGAGDDVAMCLEQMGCHVRMLEGADLTPERLAGLDAIVLGVRAFNERGDLAANMPGLLKWVEDGGTLIVQYNRPNGLKTDQIGPYELSIQGNAPALRVTDEDAPVRFLLPDHPALNHPNKITAADFEGWVQERSTYQPSKWDSEHYKGLLAMSDPGETQPDSSLLVADYGRGHYVYSGVAFFRQLPAGVPGAYRLFANLLSLGK